MFLLLGWQKPEHKFNIAEQSSKTQAFIILLIGHAILALLLFLMLLFLSLLMFRSRTAVSGRPRPRITVAMSEAGSVRSHKRGAGWRRPPGNEYYVE